MKRILLLLSVCSSFYVLPIGGEPRGNAIGALNSVFAAQVADDEAVKALSSQLHELVALEKEVAQAVVIDVTVEGAGGRCRKVAQKWQRIGELSDALREGAARNHGHFIDLGFYKDKFTPKSEQTNVLIEAVRLGAISWVQYFVQNGARPDHCPGNRFSSAEEVVSAMKDEGLRSQLEVIFAEVK